MATIGHYVDAACRCIEKGETDAPPPRGCPPAQWRALLRRLQATILGATAGVGLGCASDQLDVPMDADGCPRDGQSIYCEVPQSLTIPAGAAGAVTGLQVTVQEEGFIQRLVVTEQVAGESVSVQIDSISNLGKNYIPNGAVNASAYLVTGSNNALLRGTRITSTNPLVLAVQRLATTTAPVILTWTVKERR